MKYDVYLTARAKRQYERLDAHIRNKIRTELLEIEEDPYKNGELLQGLRSRLRYIKIIHACVQYRAVYDIAKDKKEVLVIIYRFKRKLLQRTQKILSLRHRFLYSPVPPALFTPLNGFVFLFNWGGMNLK